MDDEELVLLAARLVQCAPGDVLAVRLRENGGLVVVWGIGWKKVFPFEEVEVVRGVLRQAVSVRAQMIGDFQHDAGPRTSDLYVLFPRHQRLVMTLVRAGFASSGAVQAAMDEELLAISGIGRQTLQEIRDVLPFTDSLI